MLNVIGRGKGAKLRIIPASGKGLRASSNIANPVPASTGWTEIAPGVWECDGVTVGAATTLILAQEADGLVIGQSYLLSATITGTADILIRSGSTTLDTNWDGSPKVFTPDNGNFNIFQRAGGYTIQSIVIREAAITALGVESVSEVGTPIATILAPAATGVESLSEVGLANKAWVAIGVESASEVGEPTVTILAPAAVGVESASEVGIIPVDTVAPTMTDDTYDEGTTTFSATLDEDAVLHVLVSDTEPLTSNDIIFGTGLFKTTYYVTVGINTDPIEFSTVPDDTYWLGIQPVDAAGNADFAQAHVAQYVFPGGYVATGVESASEVGSPVAQGTATAATGVESVSEVGTPSATILAPAATGVESTSEVGAATASSVQAPAATGVESTSEVGAATASSVQAPAATGVESASEVGEANPPATGGASGNFTFSLVQSNGETSGGADPQVRTFGSNITAGNLLLALCAERSGGNPANHTVTDNNSKTWIRVPALNIDNSVVGDETNTRMTFSCWLRKADATGETNPAPTITLDDGTTNNKMMLIAELAPSAPYDWTIGNATITGSGASDWDNLNSGSVSTTGDDVCVIGVAASRFSSTRPTNDDTHMNMDEYSLGTWAMGASNAIGFILRFNGTSQADSGSYSSTVDTAGTGTGNEGVCGTLLMTNG